MSSSLALRIFYAPRRNRAFGIVFAVVYNAAEPQAPLARLQTDGENPQSGRIFAKKGRGDSFE
jgi:hypothetical protein